MEHGPSGTDSVDHKPGGPPHQGGWMFPALLVVLLAVAAAIAIANRQSGADPNASGTVADWTPSQSPEGETVALEIDFGNGTKKLFAALPWRPGMTVADLMVEAQNFRPGLRFTQQGEGASGFLNSLDGLSNEGAGGRNWLYFIDERFGESSFCLAKLDPGTRVLWEFAAQQ